MKKSEHNLVRILHWLIIPLFFFILFWWLPAFLKINHIVNFSDKVIAFSALSGLLIGLFTTHVFQKRLIENFYFHNFRTLIFVYLILSILAFAFLMGLPLANFLLGMLGGMYVIRRMAHNKKDNTDSFSKRSARFMSFVTSFWVFVISVIIYFDEASLNLIKKNINPDIYFWYWPLILSAVLISYLIQYFLIGIVYSIRVLKR